MQVPRGADGAMLWRKYQNIDLSDRAFAARAPLPRRRKANLATSQVNFACLLYSLRLLFRANTTVLREAAVKISALRESKFALARPLFAGAVLQRFAACFSEGARRGCAPILPTLSCRAARLVGARRVLQQGRCNLPCPPFAPAPPLSRKYYSFARGCGTKCI